MRVAVMLVLVWATWEPVEAATRPVVTFTPERNKIFTRESITMSCDVKSTVDETYVWYKDGEWIHTGKSYIIQQAQQSDSGRYQCQTSIGDKSDSVRLDVLNNFVLLQAPPYIFEGDNVTLRCSKYPGYAAKQTIFYQDDNVIQDWGPESELLIENVFMKAVWRYRCTKQVYHNLLYYQHSDEVTLSVQELFTTPILRLTEGDARILTCETSLSPLRETTELQFAFYRDGSNVQAYSLTNKYTVSSILLKNSGSYTCQVRTSNNSVGKTSLPLKIDDTMTEPASSFPLEIHKEEPGQTQAKESDIILIVKEEAATRPVVIFTPERNKIFTGDTITMSCDMKSTVHETYVWYKDGEWIHTGKSYTIQQSQLSDSGRYQCQTSISDKSDSVRLDVLNNFVLLQAPPYIFEGDDVTLRCSHYPSYSSRLTKFYKDNNVIQDWGPDSELLIENVFMKAVWRYKCTKEVYHNLLYYQHSDEVTFSVQELFTTPILRLTEGDARILTCETSLSPLRDTTELQFAFYRDGSNVQAYSLTNKYTVSSFWLKGSGSYTCQVRTSTDTVEKTSLPLKIADTMTGANNFILPVTLVVSFLLFAVFIIFLFRRKCLYFSAATRQKEDLPFFHQPPAYQATASENAYIVIDE